MVSGDWTVPKVSGIPGGSMDAWVGIDGEGTKLSPSNRSARQETRDTVGVKYYAVYEMRPGPESKHIFLY